MLWSVLWQADSCFLYFASALFVPICACAVQNSAHPLYIDLIQHGNTRHSHTQTDTHTFTRTFFNVPLSRLPVSILMNCHWIISPVHYLTNVCACVCEHICMCACIVLHWGRPWLQDTIRINKQTNEDKALIWRELSKDNGSVYVSACMCTNLIRLKVIHFCLKPSLTKTHSFELCRQTGDLSHCVSSVSTFTKGLCTGKLIMEPRQKIIWRQRVSAH